MRIKTLFLTRAMLELYSVFLENEINFFPIKGPIWAKKIYGNLSQRWFSDLDFMFPIESFEKIDRILISLGYKFESDLQNGFESHVKHGHEFKYVKFVNGYRILVEPHFRLNTKCSQISLLYSDLELFLIDDEIFNVQMPLLNPTGMFIVALMNHISTDNMQSIKEINDLKLLFENFTDKIDWKYVIDFCKTKNLQHFLLLSSSICNEKFDVKLPIVLQAKQNLDPKLKLLKIYTLIKFGKKPSHILLKRNFENLAFRFLLLPNMQSRLKLIFEYILKLNVKLKYFYFEKSTNHRYHWPRRRISV